MIVQLEGEVRGIYDKKEKSGKAYKNLVVEQKTLGPTEKVYVKTFADGRKVGDKVSLKCRVFINSYNNKTYLNVVEVEK